jgi:hypothetical protein
MTDLSTTTYGLALFLHVLGVIALFGGFIVAQQLRAVPLARRMIPSGGAMILVGGLTMVAVGGWRLSTSWIGPTMLALLVLVPLAMIGLRGRAVPLWVANGLALASLWNMTTKPSTPLGAWLAILVGAAGGAGVALARGRREVERRASA